MIYKMPFRHALKEIIGRQSRQEGIQRRTAWDPTREVCGVDLEGDDLEGVDLEHSGPKDSGNGLERPSSTLEQNQGAES